MMKHKECKCCSTSAGITFNNYGVMGKMNARNGGIMITTTPKGTTDRVTVFAPANYCPWCGRELAIKF